MRKSEVTKRFLEYITYDTQSDYSSDELPSTDSQKELARLLYKQCVKLGADATITESGYVYCLLKGNVPSKSVGFIAHLDTSPDFSGSGINPRIVDYKGGDIALNGVVTLSPERFPSLNSYIGQKIIVTDGTTLLGADDKAGVAEIMTALSYIAENISADERPDIYAAFTPDEEIGRGMDNFDVTLFKPDYAYTVDGGKIGELQYECFNAARAKIIVSGESVHPGYAKGIMKNAVIIASELIGMLPKNETPAETEGYEGFFHAVSLKANVDLADISIIIRDFDKTMFERRKTTLEAFVRGLNKKYNDTIKMIIKDEYANMRDVISSSMEVVEVAKSAYKAAGITPDIKPIRGGTDGSRLTFIGIPCPNIFAGGHNFHGPYEYIPINSMEKAVSVILNIVKIAKEC